MSAILFRRQLRYGLLAFFIAVASLFVFTSHSYADTCATYSNGTYGSGSYNGDNCPSTPPSGGNSGGTTTSSGSSGSKSAPSSSASSSTASTDSSSSTTGTSTSSDTLTGGLTGTPSSDTTTTSSSDNTPASGSNILLNDYPNYTSASGKQVSATLNQVVHFMVGSEAHTVTVSNLSDGSVTVIVASTPTSLTIQKGQTVKHDVNGDGKPDIAITYNGLDSNGNALLTFQALSSSGPSWILIGSIIALIAAAIIATILIIRRRRNTGSSSPMQYTNIMPPSPTPPVQPLQPMTETPAPQVYDTTQVTSPIPQPLQAASPMPTSAQTITPIATTMPPVISMQTTPPQPPVPHS